MKRVQTVVVDMGIKEKVWKSAPTKRDYADAKKLLKDFGISNPKFPECKTIGELQKFTKATINMQLA